MRPREWLGFDDGPDWPRLVFLALAVATVVAVGVASAITTAPFNPYGPTWEGTSDLRAAWEADPDRQLEVLTDAAQYDDLEAARTVAVVVAPTEAYGEDAAHLAAFLDRGGTLVLLESVGPHGNDLAVALGAEARVDGRILQDERHHARGPLMPVATDVADHALTAGIERVTLNYATSVDPGGATVLVSTSPFAYLGAPDAELDDDADLRAYPVATVEPVGAGRFVLVGDPSVAINAMLDEPDNRAFVLGLAGDADVVAIDASHGPPLPPTRRALLWLGRTPAAQLALGLGLIAGLALLGERRLPARRERRPAIPPPTPAARRAHLARRHPEWDDERLERVVGALNRAGTQRERERR